MMYLNNFFNKTVILAMVLALYSVSLSAADLSIPDIITLKPGAEKPDFVKENEVKCLITSETDTEYLVDISSDPKTSNIIVISKSIVESAVNQSELRKSEKVASEEFQKIKNLSHTEFSLDPSQYSERITAIESFIKKNQSSTLVGAARLLKMELEKEMERVKIGEVKIGQQWFSKENWIQTGMALELERRIKILKDEGQSDSMLKVEDASVRGFSKIPIIMLTDNHTIFRTSPGYKDYLEGSIASLESAKNRVAPQLFSEHVTKIVKDRFSATESADQVVQTDSYSQDMKKQIRNLEEKISALDQEIRSMNDEILELEGSTQLQSQEVKRKAAESVKGIQTKLKRAKDDRDLFSRKLERLEENQKSYSEKQTQRSKDSTSRLSAEIQRVIQRSCNDLTNQLSDKIASRIEALSAELKAVAEQNDKLLKLKEISEIVSSGSITPQQSSDLVSIFNNLDFNFYIDKSNFDSVFTQFENSIKNSITMLDRKDLGRFVESIQTVNSMVSSIEKQFPQLTKLKFQMSMAKDWANSLRTVIERFESTNLRDLNNIDDLKQQINNCKALSDSLQSKIDDEVLITLRDKIKTNLDSVYSPLTEKLSTCEQAEKVLAEAYAKHDEKKYEEADVLYHKAKEIWPENPKNSDFNNRNEPNLGWIYKIKKKYFSDSE